MITKSQMKQGDVKKLESCVFFIEATTCEQYYLWKDYHIESNWKDDSQAFSYTIGFINDDINLGVRVTFTFAEVYGYIICFYSCDSRYSDYFMIENFIKDNFPVYHDKGTRLSMVNATNFHNCIIPLRDGNVK